MLFVAKYQDQYIKGLLNYKNEIVYSEIITKEEFIKYKTKGC